MEKEDRQNVKQLEKEEVKNSIGISSSKEVSYQKSEIDEQMEVIEEITGEKYYNCKICLKTNLSRSLMRIHIKNHMRSDLKCPECDLVCYTKYGVKSHMEKNHSGVKEYLADSEVLVTRTGDTESSHGKHDIGIAKVLK